MSTERLMARLGGMEVSAFVLIATLGFCGGCADRKRSAWTDGAPITLPAVSIADEGETTIQLGRPPQGRMTLTFELNDASFREHLHEKGTIITVVIEDEYGFPINVASGILEPTPAGRGMSRTSPWVTQQVGSRRSYWATGVATVYFTGENEYRMRVNVEVIGTKLKEITLTPVFVGWTPTGP